MENKDNKTNLLKGDFAIPVYVLLAIVITILAYGSIVWNGFGSPEASGQFGDSFGALTSFFTGITLAGLVYTTYLQRKDLLTQIDMLKEQIDENRDSRKALEDQAKHLYDASQIGAIASKIDFFSGAINETFKESTCQELYGSNTATVSQHLIHDLDELLGVGGTSSTTLRCVKDSIFEVSGCSDRKPITIKVMHSQRPYSFVFFITHETQANTTYTETPYNLPKHDPVMVTNIDRVGQTVTINPSSPNIFIEVTGVEPSWKNVQLRVICSEFNPSDLSTYPTKVTD
jgi:hypothetical protein